MPLDLNRVVVWSRSYDEYMRFFNLNVEDLQNKKIVCCADGASSFNLEASNKGLDVTSIDPIYRYPPVKIAKIIQRDHDLIFPQIKANAKDNIWTYFTSPEEQRAHRMATMQKFLEDFSRSGLQTRYISGSLPNLPSFDLKFDIALVSHFLFLYSELLSFEFHINSIRNILKEAKELRIYPLHCNIGSESPYVAPLKKFLAKENYIVTIEEVKHEITKGSKQMMKVVKNGRH